MIELHPLPGIQYKCPKCDTANTPYDWMIPGMRNLAMLRCQNCGVEYYADLPAGTAIKYPMILYPNSGEVYDPYGIDWFSQWLQKSYSNRTSRPVDITVKEFRPVRNPILLNCLDVLYGHCFSKLLNAQYYLDHFPDHDLIVMTQPFLKWMVPEGVAQHWIVNLQLRNGTEWNDWLASEIKKKINPYSNCKLSVSFLHPHPDDLSIERFVKVIPMNLGTWKSSVASSPVVTFIWRDDRVWDKHSSMNFLERRSAGTLEQQRKNVIALSQSIRKTYPSLDFAVAGLGRSGPLPVDIQDLRYDSIDENIEKVWCERYAKSHIVIGVHGSNMHLPSALAGTVIELIGEDRYGNAFQDLQAAPCEPRSALVRYRLIPITSSPENVSTLACSILHYLPQILVNFERPWTDHKAIQADPWLVARKSKEILNRQ